jgi:hypothetical protein
MSKTLSFVLVSGDRSASLQNAEAAYDKHIAETETEQATIADAIKAVFDSFPGAALTMPTIEGMATRQLNANPSNYKTLAKLSLDYVRANSNSKRESGALFCVSKGVGGGVRRWAEIPVEAPAADTTDSQ